MANLVAQIADLRAKAERRQTSDAWLSMVILGACVTAVVPIMLGQYFMEKRDPGPGVFDITARNDMDYLVTNWLLGASVLLAFLGAFLIFRPWSHRMGGVRWGFVVVILAVVAFNQSKSTWPAAEAKTAETLRTSAFPWVDRYYTCGVGLWVDSSGVTWSANSGRDANRSAETCGFVAVYRGWERVARVPLPPEVRTEPGKPTVNVDKSGIVTVTKSGEKVLSFKISAPPN